MKTIPKHLVTVLPRVRSNSVSSPRLYSSSSLSLFDSSAPPPSRPVLSSNRLPIEGKPAEVEGSQSSQHHSHSHPPFSLALAQPQSSSGQTLANSNPQGQYALFPYSSLTHPSYAHPQTQQTSQEAHVHPRPKRQRLKYQLDVGAYGIPKRCKTIPSSRRHNSHSAYQHHSTEDIGLSVQVGEDAYFIRDNAMGVADGVGGWSKSHSRPSSTPSALFARRLMHYCSAEVDSASNSATSSETCTNSSSTTPTPTPQAGSGSRLHPPSRPNFSFTHHLRPRRPPPLPTSSAWKWSESSLSSSLPASFTLHDTFNKTTPPTSQDHNRFTFSFPEEEYSATAEREYEDSDLEQDLEDSLEELSEGIDVLQILERAYGKTLKAHVVPESLQSSATPPPRTDSVLTAPSTSVPSTQGEPKPLLTGSSTALLAILDHPPRPSYAPPSSVPTTTSVPTASSSSSPSSATSPSSASAFPPSATTSHPKTTKQPPSFVSSSPTPTATPNNNTPHSVSNAPKAKKHGDARTVQTPLKASTATATASSAPSSATPASVPPLGTSPTATAGSSATAVPESTTSLECELEECEGEYDAVIKIAHVGDCMGMLVRGEEIVWRSEEMWWDFNTPVQLGPSTQTTVTPRNSATVITIPVKADDILILASDGLSDNLWDEDVLDEVVRFKKSFLPASSSAAPSSTTTSSSGGVGDRDAQENDSGYSSSSSVDDPVTGEEDRGTTIKRRTLAGMLSEALCSRARRVSERKASSSSLLSSTLSSSPSSSTFTGTGAGSGVEVDEVPFAWRAREAGKKFSGGKNDDISVVVAVISPRANTK